MEYIVIFEFVMLAVVFGFFIWKLTKQQKQADKDKSEEQ